MIKLIPTPKYIEMSQRKRYVIFPQIFYKNVEFKLLTQSFIEIAKEIYDIDINQTDKLKNSGIIVIKNRKIKKNAYNMFVDDAGIKILVSEENGLGYAYATLIQLLEKKNKNLIVPHCTIEDFPECEYRGFMVDTARQFHTVKQLECLIDICFFYKIKYFHIHFIDNQSYTLPSKHFCDLSSEGKSYSQEEIEELNEYALSRNITIIPEFECPGHAQAMISAYPEVFGNKICGAMNDREQIYKNADSDIKKDDIVCVGKANVFENIKILLKEVIDMFPNSPYIHIGGDEANLKIWEKCSDCKKYMQGNGIDSVKRLYTHFIKKVTDMVINLGRTPIVWEGFPKEGIEELSRKTIVIAWESYYHLAPDLIKAGFKIINCSWKPLYIVPYKMPWNQKSVLEWNIYNWQHFWKKSYAYLNPINISPTKQVLGGQVCAWECNYFQHIEKTKSYLAALSERVWTIGRYVTDQDFHKKYQFLLNKLDALLMEKE